MREVRELLVDRFLDGSHVKGAELRLPRLVDRHSFAHVNPLVDLVVTHLWREARPLHVALGPAGRIL